MKTIEQVVSECAEQSQLLSDFPHCKASVEYGVKKGIEFAQQWISVKNELPKNNDIMLVKIFGGGIDTAFYTKFGMWIGVTGRVAYWRPIELK